MPLPLPGKRQRAQERESQRLWRLSAMGSELAFGIIGMVLLGWAIDYFFHTRPKGIIICTVIGVIGSGYNFIRQALILTRHATKPPRPGPPSQP